MLTTTTITINFLKFQKSSKSSSVDKTNFKTNFNSFAIKFAKDIKYFDSIYENSNNILIVDANRYVFYRNVFVFVNQLKTIAKEFVKEYRIKKLVSNYLRNNSLI